MGEAAQDLARFNQADRYAALMDVVRNRMTNRAFAGLYRAAGTF